MAQLIRATTSAAEGDRSGGPEGASPAPEGPAGGGAATGRIGLSGRRALPRGGWLLGPLLGLIFLVYPIGVVLASGPSLAQVLLAAGGAALFAGLFLWQMWTTAPLTSAPVTPAEERVRRVGVGLLAGLVVALTLAQGTAWGGLFFHVNVAAGLTLRRRDAHLVIAGLALTTLALALPSGALWMVFPTVALGLWATAFAGQVVAVAELRAAQEDLARLAVAEERLRFARDLHDLLGHSLTLITLKQELAGRLLPSAPERATQEIREAQVVARRALREVREAVAGYRQPSLGVALAGAREMLAAAGVACRIEHRAGPLPPEAEALLAWAVREGVTNVIRHSRARSCDIRLTRDPGKTGTAGGVTGPEAVRAEIRDDGEGPPAGVLGAASGTGEAGGAGSTGGSGLTGLAERVARVPGATVEAGALPAGGFRLSVSLPLPNMEREGAGR